MEVNFNTRTQTPGHTPQLPEPYPPMVLNANGKFEYERRPGDELAPEEVSAILRHLMVHAWPHALPALAPHLFELLMHGTAPMAQLHRMECLISCARYLDEPTLLKALVRIFRLNMIQLEEPDGHTMARLAHALPAACPWLKELQLFTLDLETHADAQAFFELMKCPASEVIRVTRWRITAEAASTIHHLGKQVAASAQVNTLGNVIIIGRPSGLTDHKVIGHFLGGVFRAFERLDMIYLDCLWPMPEPEPKSSKVVKDASKCDAKALKALRHQAHGLGELSLDLCGLSYKAVDGLSKLLKGIQEKGHRLHTLAIDGLGREPRANHGKRLVRLLSTVARHCPGLRNLQLCATHDDHGTLSHESFRLIGFQLGQLILQCKGLTELTCSVYPTGDGLITGLHAALAAQREGKPDAAPPALRSLRLGPVSLLTQSAWDLLDLPILLPSLEILDASDTGGQTWISEPGTEDRLQRLLSSSTLEIISLGTDAGQWAPIQDLLKGLHMNKRMRKIQLLHGSSAIHRAGLGFSSESSRSSHSDSSFAQSSSGTATQGSGSESDESGVMRSEDDPPHAPDL